MNQKINKTLHPNLTNKELAKLFIQELEGLASKTPNKLTYYNAPSLLVDSQLVYAYLDTGGVATIGYGSTFKPDGSKIKITDVIDHKTAKLWLDVEFNKCWDSIIRTSQIRLTDNQYTSLTSFAFNVGLTALYNSTLWKLIQQGKELEAANEFDRWVYDNGKKVDGLVNRRNKEQQLFLS